MDEAKCEYVRIWLLKARRDLEGARRLAARPDRILDLAIFHCQQAGEKAVKGFLAFHDYPLVKTHNIRKLVTLAEQYDPQFSSWREAGEELTPHATAFRYPAKPVDPDEEEYEQAEQAAAGLVNFVCSLLPKEAQPNH